MRRSTDLFGLRGENFRLRLEYDEEFMIIHLVEIDKFSKETFLEMKEMLEEWNRFMKTVGYEGTHAGVPVDNIPMIRILSALGFTHIGTNDGLYIFFFEGDD